MMTTKPAAPRKNAARSPGRKFEKGNPGRPKGSRHKASILLDKLLLDGAEKVLSAVMASAEKGDVISARFLLERILPPRRDVPIAFDLPALDGPDGLRKAGQAVLIAVAKGDLSPAEGEAVMALLERHRALVETAELAARVERLESMKELPL